MYSLVAKKLIPLYEFLYEFLLGGMSFFATKLYALYHLIAMFGSQL